MSNESAKPRTQAVTFRLDTATKERVDAIAASSQRTIAQLALFALIAYFRVHPITVIEGRVLAPSRDDFKSEEEGSVGIGSKNLTLRLPEDLAGLLDAYSEASRITRSETIRQAIAEWLAASENQDLGHPAYNVKDYS